MVGPPKLVEESLTVLYRLAHHIKEGYAYDDTEIMWASRLCKVHF